MRTFRTSATTLIFCHSGVLAGNAKPAGFASNYNPLDDNHPLRFKQIGRAETGVDSDMMSLPAQIAVGTRVSLLLFCLLSPIASIQAELSANLHPAAVVILIHGTFSPDADWTHPGSAFRRAIDAQFKGDVVKYETLEWPGFRGGRYNNTNLYRYSASKRLCEVAETLQKENPGVPMFLVGHSHGGNVALYAARDMGPTVKLAGIVCMGTPFVQIRPRDVQNDVALTTAIKTFAYAVWVVVLVSSIILGMSGFAASAFLMGKARWWPLRILGFVLLLPSFLLLSWESKPDGVETVWVGNDSYAYGSTNPYQSGHYETRTKWVLSDQARELLATFTKRTVGFVADFALQKQHDLGRMFDAVIPVGLPTLIQQADPPDEALGALRLSESTFGAPMAFLSNPETAEFCSALFVCVCAMGGIGMAIVSFIFTLKSEDGSSFVGRVAAGIIVGPLMGLTTAAMLAFLASLILVLLASLSVMLRAPAAIPMLISFGSTDIIGEYVTHVTAASAESIEHDGQQVTLKTYGFSNSRGLRHSQYYQNPESVADVAAWLYEQHKSKGSTSH